MRLTYALVRVIGERSLSLNKEYQHASDSCPLCVCPEQESSLSKEEEGLVARVEEGGQLTLADKPVWSKLLQRAQ
jgi:hypothetical protein